MHFVVFSNPYLSSSFRTCRLAMVAAPIWTGATPIRSQGLWSLGEDLPDILVQIALLEDLQRRRPQPFHERVGQVCGIGIFASQIRRVLLACCVPEELTLAEDRRSGNPLNRMRAGVEGRRDEDQVAILEILPADLLHALRSSGPGFRRTGQVPEASVKSLPSASRRPQEKSRIS